MATFTRGEVLLTQFPFTDLRGSTLRPCLLLSPGLIGQDLIVAAISSVVRGGAIPTDLLVEPTHAEFALTGFRTRSVVRLHKLATIEVSIIVRRLGRIGPNLQADVDRLLKGALGL